MGQEGGRPLHGGYLIALGGHKREDGSKMVTLTVGNVSESRPCPFEKNDGADMVRRFTEQHMLPGNPAIDKMLEHLVTHAAEMYGQDEIESFVFNPIHVHESDYRIDSAQIFARKGFTLRKPKVRTSDMGVHRYEARNGSIKKK